MSALALMLWIIGAGFTLGFGMKTWEEYQKINVGPKAFFVIASLFAWPYLLGCMVWEFLEDLSKQAESRERKP